MGPEYFCRPVEAQLFIHPAFEAHQPTASYAATNKYQSCHAMFDSETHLKAKARVPPRRPNPSNHRGDRRRREVSAAPTTVIPPDLLRRVLKDTVGSPGAYAPNPSSIACLGRAELISFEGGVGSYRPIR